MQRTHVFVFVACLVAAIEPRSATAQVPDSTVRSTTAGVYSAAQALRGKELYAGKCTGCHNTASHIGEPFTGSWRGKLVSDLMSYMREFMPKDNPGTLSPDESALLIAYLLQLNGMPEGAEDLPSDSTTLRGIRLDFAAASALDGRDAGARTLASLLRSRRK